MAQEKGKRERAKQHVAFIKNPFGFTKQLLGDKRSGCLMCPTEEVDCFLHETLSDPMREQELCRHLWKILRVRRRGRVADQWRKLGFPMKKTQGISTNSGQSYC